MSIEALMRAVPPPQKPLESFAGPWAQIETEIGSPLPQDYKDYARLYGSGYFLQFLHVDTPRTGNPNIRLEKQVPSMCAMFAQFDGDDRPYPLWPEPGGLMPFGGTTATRSSGSGGARPTSGLSFLPTGAAGSSNCMNAA
jgi:hypothetical protein